MIKSLKKFKKQEPQIQAIILAAGIGAIAKTHEPKCLLKYKGKTILEWQVEALRKRFKNIEITVVGGIEREKIIKKIPEGCRFLENQIYETSNNGESLRIAVENSNLNNVLFLHGDLIFDSSLLDKISIKESCVLIDTMNYMKKSEVGVNYSEDKLNILSYSMPIKWCQIAFIHEKDLKTLRKLFLSPGFKTQHLLTFEIINILIDQFEVYFKVIDIKNSFIKEIDNIKDLI